MTPTSLSHARDAGLDAFPERQGGGVVRGQVLGGDFRFRSESAALLRLVEQAYAGLPPHRLPGDAPVFEVELRLAPRLAATDGGEPPPVRMQSGAGLLCGVMDASNYVVLSPEQGRALVVASQDMLDRAYYLRYELIEFAVFMLAARRQGLVPLHGACVGRHGRGVLLMGESGAGKSTLALHSLLHGLDFLAEDAVFVHPEHMLATGVANFLHMKPEALQLVEDPAAKRWIAQAPMIRRRSGVEKHEADLRQWPGACAVAPLALVGAVLVSAERAGDASALLQAIPADEAAARLASDQPYAASQPGWQRFLQRLAPLGVHVLRRGDHPRDSVDALLALLG